MAQSDFDRLKRVRSSKSFKSKNTPSERFSGGAFMDILDVLQIPQSVATAAFSNKYRVKDSIKKRFTPSGALGLKGAQGFIADFGLDPLWFAGAGLTSSGSKALKGGTLSKTLGGGVRAGEKTLLKLGLPFSEKAVSVPKLLGLGRVEEKAAEGLTRLGGAIKRIPLGKDRTIGKVLSKKFGVTEGFKKGLSLDDIESSVASQIAAKESVKGVLRGGRVASNQALRDIEPIADKFKKLSADEAAAIDNWMYNYKKAPSITTKLSKLGREVVEDIKPLLKKVTKEADNLGLSVLKNKILTNVPVKGIEKVSGVSSGAKILQRETRPEKFANVFRVGENLYQGSKTKAVNIADSSDVLIKNGADWISSESSNILKQLSAEKEQLSKAIDGWRRQADTIKLGDVGRAKDGAVTKQTLKRWVTQAMDRLGQINDEVAALSKGKVREMAAPAEVNALRQSMGLPPLFQESGLQGLYSTITELGAYRARNVALDKIKNSSIITEVAGMSDSQLAKEGLERIKIKGLEGYAASPEVRSALEHTVNGYSSLGPLEDAVRSWHYVTNQFKKISTYWWPSFHFRNAVSNLWQITLAGVRDPLDAFRGYKTLWNVGKFMKRGYRGEKLAKALTGALGKKEYNLYKEFVENGLGGVGRYFGDLDEALIKRNFLDRAGGSVGNYLEDSSKFSLYMQRRKAGFTADAAAAEVRKYLFDYADLTDFERIVLKGVTPFYTWTRNNIPLQLGILIQKPSKINMLGAVKRSIESMQDGKPMDERLLPQWMREGYNIYLGQNPNGIQKFLKLEGFLPTIDLNMYGDIGGEVTGQLSPLIKTPLEIFTNYDFFFKRQLSEYPGQKVNVAGIEMSPELGKIARTLRPVNELAKVSGLDGQELERTDRALSFLAGINIKGFDPKKQEDVLDMLTGRNKSKIKKEIKDARKKGDNEKVEDLMELLQIIEQKTNL